MNKIITPLSPRVAFLCALLPLLGMGAIASEKKSEDPIERKIHLMAEALQAQEAGDYVTAKSRLEALLAYSPNDIQVNRLLQAVNAGISARERTVRETATKEIAGPSAAASAAISGIGIIQDSKRGNDSVLAPSAPHEEAPAELTPKSIKSEKALNAEELAEWETARQNNLIALSRAKLSHGLKLAAEERFHEALKDFFEADQNLSHNLLTEPLRREIEAARNDTQHRQRLAGFSLSGPIPKIAISQQHDEGATQQVPGEPAAISTTIDAHIVEMSPDIYADLLAAWAQFSREQRLAASGNRPILDRNGRQVFLRRAAPLPTGRQITLYWCLLGAALKSGKLINLTSPEGIVSVSGSLDPIALVKSLSRMEGCRVIAAPQVTVHPGCQTVLTLANDGSPIIPNARLGDIDSSPRTGMELRITPVQGASSADMEFVLNPSIIRYEGRSLTDATNPMYSRHESSTRIVLAPGATAIVGGLVSEDGRAIAGRETPVERFPFVGRILRERAAAGRLRELVLIITRR
ncbi:MAG: hypothetical protein WC378_15880 [Opitutaceae bacterium]|jgi:tetratricopeptide (TPR) repeat protein